MSKSWWSRFWETGYDHRLVTAAVLLALLALLAQMSVQIGFLARNMDTRAVIAAIDNDGGVAVGTASQTKLYDDNGWRPYGPLYYRAVRILHHLGAQPISTSAPTSDSKGIDRDIQLLQARERSHHFLLTLVSYLSLVSLCILLASLVTKTLFARIFTTSLLLTAFTANGTWTEMILRPHPDHLFAALAGLATWRTWVWLQSESLADRRWMAASWGLATATKMSVITFIPGLLLLFIRRERTWTFRWRELFATLGVASLTYLAVGFPQSFNFLGVIEFLLEQKRNVLPGTWDSFVGWMELFRQQLAWPSLTLVLATLVLGGATGPSKLTWSWIAWLRLGLAILCGWIYLVSQNVVSPNTWYPFPFVAAFLVIGSLGLKAALHARLNDQQRARIHRGLTNAWVQIVAFILIPYAVVGTPQAWTEQFALLQRCRPEARQVERLVNAEALRLTGRSDAILVDPYIPYSHLFHDREIRMAWDMTPERWTERVRLIALKSEYYQMYLPREEGGSPGFVNHLKDPEATRNFYRLFWKKSETTSPSGEKWKRVYRDECTFELWAPDERANPS